MAPEGSHVLTRSQGHPKANEFVREGKRKITCSNMTHLVINDVI